MPDHLVGRIERARSEAQRSCGFTWLASREHISPREAAALDSMMNDAGCELGWALEWLLRGQQFVHRMVLQHMYRAYERLRAVGQIVDAHRECCFRNDEDASRAQLFLDAVSDVESIIRDVDELVSRETWPWRYT